MESKFFVRGIGAAAVAGVIAAPLLLTAPAQSQSMGFDDGDDTSILADIHRVRVNHTDDQVRTVIRFDDLVRNSPKRSQGVSVFFDTDPADKGPEYVFVTGLNDGTDYTVLAVESWGDQGSPVVDDCNYRVRLNWRTDTARMVLDRSCLGSPEAVRVAVKSGEWRKGRGTRHDWLSGRRVFTDPISAG